MTSRTCNAYFRFFNGRPYIEGCTYLVITQESKKSALLSYDNSKWRDFLVKIRKVADQLHDGGIKSAEFLNVQQAREYADRFFALNFRDAHFSMTNFKVDSEAIHMGTRQCKVYSLLDVDSVGLPGVLRPYVDMTVNNAVMPVDLMSEIDHIPDVDTVIYNARQEEEPSCEHSQSIKPDGRRGHQAGAGGDSTRRETARLCPL